MLWKLYRFRIGSASLADYQMQNVKFNVLSLERLRPMKQINGTVLGNGKNNVQQDNYVCHIIFI